MRAECGLLPDPDIAAASDEVDNSGLMPLLRGFVHLGRGRPPRLLLLALLFGLHRCTKINTRRIILERHRHPLLRDQRPVPRTPLSARLPRQRSRFRSGFAVVHRLFPRRAMVPSPLPANKSLSREEADRLITAADPNVLAAREHRLALFTEFALDAAVCPLRDLLAELSDSSLAVDAITVHTSARGREPRGSELSTDSDAGWYVREGDHRDPDTASAADVIRPPQKAGSGQPMARESRKPSLKKRAKYLLGYDAAFAVTRDSPYDDVLVDDNTTSSVSRRRLRARSWWRGPGTAPPCRNR